MIKRNLIIAVSGSGRSLENLIRYSSSIESCFKISSVICSTTKCRALEVAKSAGLEIFTADFSSPTADLLKNLHNHCQSADLICLAGFLKRFPMLQGFEHKIINIHPALLPAFSGRGMYGQHVHKAVLQAGVKESGATVHFVDDQYDHGQIISQIRVPVWTDDTHQSLADRVFAAELRLLPETINDIFSEKLPLPNKEIYFYEG